MSINELTSIQKSKNTQNTSKTKQTKSQKTKSNKPVLNAADRNTNPISAPSTGWHTVEFKNIMSSWGIRNYQWTSITDTDDAVKKSQNHLIDMIRYYEGDPKNNYKAKMQYADKSGTTTNGYGIVNPHLKFSAQIKEKYHLQFPIKTEYDAYKTMLVYMEEVAKKDVINRLGGVKEGTELYNSLPSSIKEALLDYAFKNGGPTLNKIDGLKKALQDKNWPKVIECLIWTKANAGDKKDQEMAGLYRRSLSRIILAAKDLPKSPEIEAKIEKLYKDGLAKAAKEGASQDDFHKIYNEYKGITTTLTSEKTNSDGTKSYRSNNGNKTVFSVAKNLRPDVTPGDVDRTKLLKAIINLIIDKNSLPTYGEEGGYPKTEMLKEGVPYKFPTEITFNNHTIKLNAPAEMEDVTDSVKEQKPEVHNEVKKPDTIKADTIKYDTISAELPKIKEKEEKSDNSGWWKSGLIGAGLGLLAGLAKKASNIRIAGIAGIGLAAGLGVFGLIKLFGKKKKEEVVEQREPVTNLEKMIQNDKVDIQNIGELQLMTINHKILKGETTWRISKNYCTTIDSLKNENNLTDVADIKADANMVIKKIGYTVKEGETLSDIAQKFRISQDVLFDINKFESEDDLQEGTTIEIPGIIHVVKENETLTEIAKKYGMEVDDVARINEKSLQDRLNAGDKIIITNKKPDISAISNSKDMRNNIDINKYGWLNSCEELWTMERDAVTGEVLPARKEFYPTEEQKKKGKLSGYTIIVNAGHGYTSDGKFDQGTLAPDNGNNKPDTMSEVFHNYHNAMRLKDKLLEQGAKVIYMQGGASVIMKELKKDNNKANLFVSVHVNQHDKPTKDRTQLWTTTNMIVKKNKQGKIIRKEKRFASKNDEKINNMSKDFAEYIEKKFDKWIPEHFGKIVPSQNEQFIFNGEKDYAQTQEEGLGVCTSAIIHQHCPSLLWETAFMIAPLGRRRLNDEYTMNGYADTMVKAIAEYLPKISKPQS